MPLPLLAIPLVAAAASGGGISVGALIGSILSSALGGSLLGAGIHKAVSENHNKKSDKHSKSRHKQDQMAAERINGVQALVSEVPEALAKLVKAVEEGTISSNDATQAVVDVKERLKVITPALDNAMHVITMAGLVLVITKEQATNMMHNFELLTSYMESIIQQLKDKEAEITQLREDVRVLTISLDAQVALTKRLEAVSVEQEHVIEELSGKLRTSEEQLATKIQHLRFFKELERSSMPPKDTPQPESPSFNI